MAGIGFELRNLLKDKSYSGQLRAYGFAGIISSGPWVIPILSVLFIGIWGVEESASELSIAQFQVSVTYLMATSLILTSPLQLLFTRFISDRFYEKRNTVVLPNLLGAITLVTLISGILGLGLLLCYFTGSLIYQVLMLTGFVTLSNMWIVITLLSSLREWRYILLAFVICYGITILAALGLKHFGLEGLMAGFLVGHILLFFLLLGQVLRSYPGQQLLAFDFLRRDQIFPSLAITGFCFNLAIWADKLIFWFNPFTSISIIEPLRVSLLYDLPIFLAYLSIVPGMAVFMLLMETDFAEQYDAYYKAIREGHTLEEILYLKNNMVNALRQGSYKILKVQGMTVIILLGVGGDLLHWFGISDLYRLLFRVDVIAVGVQLMLLVALNALFYLDKRRVVLQLSLLFIFSNIGFTLLTQYLGPAFYGYGFALAVTLTSLVGFSVLSHKLDALEYETFMLQRGL